MNFNAHSFGISAYMTLMFTSAFMTLNLPGPLSFAAAGGGLEVAASRLSLRFQAVGMTLPPAPSASIRPLAAGELRGIADKVEEANVVANVPAPLAAHFGLNNGGGPVVAKSSSTGTVQPRFLRAIQIVRKDGKRYIVLGVYKGTEGWWYLTDDDGVILKAAYKAKGAPLQDISIGDAEAPFGLERTFWASRAVNGDVLVGQAGS